MQHLKHPVQLLRDIAFATLFALVFGLLAGCATQPRSFNAYAVDVIASADQVVITTRTLLRADAITADDAENVLKAAEVARDGVRVARGVAATQGTAAGMSRLRLAADAIDKLAEYTAAKKSTSGVK